MKKAQRKEDVGHFMRLPCFSVDLAAECEQATWTAISQWNPTHLAKQENEAAQVWGLQYSSSGVVVG